MRCGNHWDGLYTLKSTVMVGFSMISRVRIMVSVKIRIMLSFIGANLYITMAPLNFTRPQMF